MSFNPPPPTWLSENDALSAGQDFMALRNPANRIGYVAMNGLTSVTPRVRYLSFREWMLATWWRMRGEDRRGAFTDFAQRVEAAIVLANLRAGVSIGGLIGSEKGGTRLLEPSPWPLDKLVENPGAIIYAGATDQLGLDTTQFDQGGQLVVRKVAGPTLGRGQELARIVGKRLRTCRLGSEMCEGRVPDASDEAALDELADLVRLDRIPAPERQALIEVLVPTRPHPDTTPELRAEELRRLGSYALLLELADRLEGIPADHHVFAQAASGGTELSEALHPILDVWALFCVRDLLAACHEASMRAITEALETVAKDGEATSEQVLTELLSQGDALSRALRDLDLLDEGEVWDHLGFRELHKRVAEACADGPWERRGLRRWSEGLTEAGIASTALRHAAGPGPLALLPVAWTLATLRLSPALAGAPGPFFDLVNTHPFPIQTHVAEEVGRWLADDTPLPQLVARLARDSVALHLDTAWTRMQRNARSDTAHLHAEGELWRPRQTWREGRATSRLDNAIGWLQQLELIDDDGLTARGRELRDAALTTLHDEVDA